MKDNIKKPCNACPFVKGCAQGWLGGETPTDTYSFVVMAEGDFACHKTRPGNSKDNMSRCRGSLLFLKKHMKIPRYNSALRDAVNRIKSNVNTSHIFTGPEFISYHQFKLEKMKTGTVAFNKAKTKFEAFFVASQMFTITNLLWQLIVNETWEGKRWCFYPVIADRDKGKITIGLVEMNKAGYSPMHTQFAEGLSLAEAENVAYDMNKEIIGLSREDVDAIVASSMPKSKQKTSTKKQEA